MSFPTTQVQFAEKSPGNNATPRSILLQIQQQQERILQILDNHTRRLDELSRTVPGYAQQQHKLGGTQNVIPTSISANGLVYPQGNNPTPFSGWANSPGPPNGISGSRRRTAATEPVKDGRELPRKERTPEPDLPPLLYPDRPPIPSGTIFPTYQAALDGIKAHEQRLNYHTAIANSDLRPSKGKARVYFACVHSGQPRKKVVVKPPPDDGSGHKRNYKDRGTKKTNCPFRFCAVATGPHSGGTGTERKWTNCPWEIVWDETKHPDCGKHNHLGGGTLIRGNKGRPVGALVSDSVIS